MILKSLIVVGLVGALSGMMGCASARSPVTGFFYTDTHSDVTATSNAVGTKAGQACATSILGVYASGDASIESARKVGGITQITSVDDSSWSLLGLYAKYCTIVRGK